MTVSVIIPVYNVGAMGAEAVASALGQSHPLHEVIVVDDGSTDDTAAHLVPWLDRIRYVRQPNGGVSAARNRGLALASGDLVAFLDGDDVWHHRKLEVQLGAWQRHPDLGCLGTRSYAHPGPEPALPTDPDVAVQLIPWSELVIRNRFMTSTILVERALIAQVGQFDETLRGAEDHDLWLRIARLRSAALLPVPLTGYRSVPGSLSKNAALMEDGMRRLLGKLDAGHDWPGLPGRHLRRKAYGHLNLSAAHMFATAGEPKIALGRLIRSIAWYPQPFAAWEVQTSWIRAKLMVRYLVQWWRQATDPMNQTRA